MSYVANDLERVARGERRLVRLDLTFGLRSSMRSRAESSLRLPIALVP